MLPFDLIEFQKRLHNTKRQMVKKGIEVLLVTDPANMNYLTGYDAWSFYVHQMVVVIIDEPQPIWLGRFQDANGAKVKTWLYEKNIISYPDYYVHSDSHHPMDFMASILSEIGQGTRRIGVEMDHYYFSAKAFERLRQGLPNAEFTSADLLVNGVRLIKSDKEIEYMERAARLAEQAMHHGIETIRTGVRECEVAAKIYYYMIAGTEEFGGDYPAIVPLLPSGKNTGIPHLTWTDRKLDEGDSIVIELAGCYHRYHAPLARTVSIGAPPPKLAKLGLIVTEGVNRVLDAAKPGVTCGELEEVWRKIIRKYGIEKEARLGYSVGLGYPPDWGEHTASIRREDKTVLQPNMTFHLIPALWFNHYGLEISETFKVSENGSETLTQFSRELIVKHPFIMTHQDGEIS